jgi:hypothetical protein
VTENPDPLVLSLSKDAGEARVVRQAHHERRLRAAAFSAGAGRLAGLVPRLLGWRPDEFWSATPAELAAIFAASEAPEGAPLSRDELAALMERESDE